MRDFVTTVAGFWLYEGRFEIVVVNGGDYTQNPAQEELLVKRGNVFRLVATKQLEGRSAEELYFIAQALLHYAQEGQWPTEAN